MLEPAEIKKILEGALRGAVVRVVDLTGTKDHFQVEVVSELFRGKMLIEQHQMVQKPLGPYIQDERIHALTIKTYLPEAVKKNGNLIELE